MYWLRIDPHLPWQPAAVEAAKRAAYDGFRIAAEVGPRPGRFGVIVDARSTVILRDAAAQGFATACTIGFVDNLNQDGADVDDGVLEAAAREAAYWRVVVRFNPDDDQSPTPRQIARLRRLSRMLASPAGPRLICDLVVPPTLPQLARGILDFDRQLLPPLTTRAVAWLEDAGVSPELWVVEGFADQADYEHVVAEATRVPDCRGCLVRAAGHSEATTFGLMAVGLATPGIAGVVLGPAPFWEPVAAWMMGRTTRGRAVAGLAAQFRNWIERLDATRAHPSGPAARHDGDPSNPAPGEPDLARSAFLPAGAPAPHTSPSAAPFSARTDHLRTPVS